ncbi:dihydrofolate reductase family protein [Mesorhizobium sp.]|uniref:dihydrofolate reductase family protein n=1 Tax=Mesorhizobium sp. TaxID=1871066 RepID=UPI000FE6DE02|nr:dihydrofolate reductase family protein [Mesorhizobium sp.]RWP70800.1 MAG: dihydrofolate reductase [Mesorhizobium sp.]
MRKLITGMKISLDGKMEGPEGYADWVDAWSEEYGLMPQIDACLLGSAMYAGYERYWTAIQSEPDKPLPMTGKLPTPAELEWARFAEQTPHYVLSNTMTSALWPKTRFVRTFEDIAALKQQPGKDIYLMGGARMTASLIDAGLVDELRLIVYPLLVGDGKALFATTQNRRGLELRKVGQLSDGRVSLVYGIGYLSRSSQTFAALRRRPSIRSETRRCN